MMLSAPDDLAACLDLKAPAHEEGIVYILRFERPIGNPAKAHGSAQFYIGWCHAGGLEKRLAAHRLGNGARLTAAAAEQGIAFDLIVCFMGTRLEERRLKNQKNARMVIERRAWERKQRGRIPF